MPTWEIIPVDDKHQYETCRLKVPGGWLVRTRYASFEITALACVFFEDPTHTWEFSPNA